jgi:glycosyltransferase involved in cell wall biosynthesis
MPQPKVSIITACYNHRNYLEECIKSISEQTYTNIEHIIINDGSTDGSGEVADQLAAIYGKPGKTIRVIHQANAGVGLARNNGIAQSNGDLLSLLDADDFFRPDAVEKMVRQIKAFQVDCVTPFAQTFGAYSRLVKYEGSNLDVEKENNTYFTSSMFSRKISESIGGFDTNIRELQIEDWIFWLEMLKAGFRATALPEPVVYYRTASVSGYTKVLRQWPQAISYVVTKHPDLYAPDVVKRAAFIHQHRLEFRNIHGQISAMLGNVSLLSFMSRHLKSTQMKYALLYGATPNFSPLGLSATLRMFDMELLEAVIREFNLEIKSATDDVRLRASLSSRVMWKFYRILKSLKMW